jgi:hypothetical protein
MDARSIIRAPASDSDRYAFQRDRTFFEQYPGVRAFIRESTPAEFDLAAQIAGCAETLRPFGDGLKVAVIRVDPETHVRIPLVNPDAFDLALSIAGEALE